MILNKFKRYFKDKNGIKKILLIRIDRLGDLVLTLPALKAVREAFPKAEVSFLINKKYFNLVENNPWTDKIFLYDADNQAETLNTMKKQGFDLAIDFLLGKDLTSAKIAFKSNAKYRAGFGVGLRRIYLNLPVKPPPSMEYEADLALRVLRGLGIKEKGKKIDLFLTKKDKKSVEIFLEKNKVKTFACIHPGVAKEASGFKQWSPDKFAKLADRIVEQKNLAVVFTGSLEEKPLIEKIKGLMKKKEKAFNAAGMLTLRQLCALLKNSALFISNNTGPMHLSIAQKVPSVIISARTSFVRWIPSDADFITTVPSYNPETLQNERHEEIAKELSEVTVEDVWNAVDKKISHN